MMPNATSTGSNRSRRESTVVAISMPKNSFTQKTISDARDTHNAHERNLFCIFSPSFKVVYAVV